MGAAVGETWVANKPGGLNVRNSTISKLIPHKVSLWGNFGEADPLNLLGKAADVGEVTGRGTLQPDGVMAQASWERLAEVTSGSRSEKLGRGGTVSEIGETSYCHPAGANPV
jgi:hypothetical protein